MKGRDDVEKKKLGFSDWWYYYKIHVIVALVIVLGIGYSIYMDVTQQKIDMHIDCITDMCFSSVQCNQLQNDLTQSDVIPDVDGDGAGIAQISSYIIGMNNKQDVDAQNIEVAQIRMTLGQSPIVITDKEVIKAYEHFEMFEDITNIANNVDAQDVIKDKQGNVIAVSLDNSEWLKKNNINIKGLYLTLRIPSADITMDEQLIKEFENAKKVAEYIIK